MFFPILLIIIVITTIILPLRTWRAVAAYDSPDIDAEASDNEAAEALPKVSIVAFALRNEENLSDYLDSLFAQDYPDFEVVLVCDASAEATAMLSEKFENINNLHITFIPPGSHSLSRRKLAQTIGIKAAKGDLVVITASNAAPGSTNWLRSLTAPLLNPSTSAALGYLRPDFNGFSGAGKWYRRFDSLLSSITWIGSAIDGNPYRGDGFNLAFRRQLFFDNKGYASTLTLMDGDDDVFITELNHYGECVAAISPDAILDVKWGSESNRIHTDLKERYDFTRRLLPKKPFLLSALISWAQWLSLTLFLLTTIFAIPTIWPAVAEIFPAIAKLPATSGLGFTDPIAAIAAITAAGIAMISLWLTEIILFRRAVSRLGIRFSPWTIIPFLLWRPIGNLLFHLNHYSTRHSHLTLHN